MRTALFIALLAFPLDALAQPMEQLFPAKRAPSSDADVKNRTGLTREEIEKLVADRESDFKSCLESFYKLRGVRINLNVNGTLHVLGGGEVEYIKSLTVTGVAVNQSFLACLEGRIKAWRFPKFSADYMDVSFSRSFAMSWAEEKQAQPPPAPPPPPKEPQPTKKEEEKRGEEKKEEGQKK